MVPDDGRIPLVGTSQRIVAPAPGEPARGITGWSLHDAASPVADVDGLPPTHVAASPPLFADHRHRPPAPDVAQAPVSPGVGRR